MSDKTLSKIHFIACGFQGCAALFHLATTGAVLLIALAVVMAVFAWLEGNRALERCAAGADAHA